MEALLSPVQLAAMLGISVQTIYHRRTRGESMLTCVKLGGLIRYHPEDVRAWLGRQSENVVIDLSASARSEGVADDKIPKKRGRPTKAEQLRRSHGTNRLAIPSMHHRTLNGSGECQSQPVLSAASMELTKMQGCQNRAPCVAASRGQRSIGRF
ncbi:helix-turn-helix domain-containing protein [Achromobacter aegrifaciens]|uniref:helix-turn-helix domain-containing protein n=1 Tax=Achromobacter aegrifaciens TaxID=1287736 RepID=UPI003209AB50